MPNYLRMLGAALPLIALLSACGAELAITPVAPQIVAPTVTSTTAAPASMVTSAPRPEEPAVVPTVSPTNPLPQSPTAAAAIRAQSDLASLSLTAENAPPTPADHTPERLTPSQPARIIIPDIGLDLETLAVGLDAKQIPIVPKHEPGWFTRSAVPGQGTNVVFWGHVLRWQDSPKVAAPFARLEELKPGAMIEIVTADGKVWSYRVKEQLQARPEDVYFLYPTLTERVTLVSCIGDKVIRDGTLTKELRLVTVAEPVR